MQLFIEEDYEAMSKKAAECIACFINQNPGALLCLAGGNTPLGVFEHLIQMQQDGKVELNSVYYAELDEWVGLGYEEVGSCKQLLADNFYNKAQIQWERVHYFDGLATDMEAECRLMERWLADHGGLGLTLLGIGMNGHIGFNEPNGSDARGCFTVQLDEITKEVSAKYFNKVLPVETGITIGWKELYSSKEVIFIANGKQKAPIIQKSLYEAPTATVPASLFQTHPSLTVVLDQEAACKV